MTRAFFLALALLCAVSAKRGASHSGLPFQQNDAENTHTPGDSCQCYSCATFARNLLTQTTNWSVVIACFLLIGYIAAARSAKPSQNYKLLTQFFMLLALNAFITQNIIGTQSIGHHRGFTAILSAVFAKDEWTSCTWDFTFRGDFEARLSLIVDLVMIPTCLFFFTVQNVAPYLTMTSVMRTVSKKLNLKSPSCFDSCLGSNLDRLLDNLSIFGCESATRLSGEVFELSASNDPNDVPQAESVYQNFFALPLFTVCVFLGQTILVMFYMLALFEPWKEEKLSNLSTSLSIFLAAL
jgi:hypothetical protein